MKTIQLKLTSESVNNSIKELNSYKTWLAERTKVFLDELGKEGVDISSARFEVAEYDGSNDVSVSVEQRESNRVAIVAIGWATLFIEFGTGLTYKTFHPEDDKHHMYRGQYGFKLGRLPNGWRYRGDPGTHGKIIWEGKHAGDVHTYGNPANMCMYYTVRDLEEKFEDIARRVYV